MSLCIRGLHRDSLTFYHISVRSSNQILPSRQRIPLPFSHTAVKSHNNNPLVRPPITYVQISQCFYKLPNTISGPGSSVGIAIGYGLDGPGIESRWGEIFRNCPDRPWGPPSLLYNGYRVFPGGRKLPGRDADTSPLLVPRSKNRVQLYLYSP
jgi:hypothetical protein